MTDEKSELVLTSHKSVAISVELKLQMVQGRGNIREASSIEPLSSTHYQVKHQRTSAVRTPTSTYSAAAEMLHLSPADIKTEFCCINTRRSSHKRKEGKICNKNYVCYCNTLYDRHPQQQQHILKPEYNKQQTQNNICLTVRKTQWSSQLGTSKVGCAPKLNKISASELKTPLPVGVTTQRISDTISTYASTTISQSEVNYRAHAAAYTTTLTLTPSILVAEQLGQAAISDGTVKTNVSERMSMPTKVGHKLFTITTPTTTLRNTCFIIAYFFIILTAHHLLRQNLLSPVAAAATTTTASANAVKTSGHITAAVTSFDLSERYAFNNNLRRALIRQRQTLYNPQPRFSQIQWSLKRSDSTIAMQSLRRWHDSVSTLLSVAVKTKYKFPFENTESKAIHHIDQRNAGENRLIQQHKVLHFIPKQTNDSFAHNNKVLHRELELSTKMSKVENAFTFDYSLKQLIKFIYSTTNIKDLFNKKQATGDPQLQAISVLRQHRRSKRHVVDTVINNTYETKNGTASYNKISMDTFAKETKFNFRKAFVDVSYSSIIYAADVPRTTNISANDYYNTRKITFNSENTIIRNSSDLSENNEDNRKLLQLIMDGLGLKQLPDMTKVNISQQEYVTKYREYLIRTQERKRREIAALTYTIPAEWELENASLHIVSVISNVSVWNQYSRRKRNTRNLMKGYSSEYYYPDDDVANAEHETITDNLILPRKQRNNDDRIRLNQNGKTRIILHFSLDATDIGKLKPGDIEEANIRFILIHSAALAAKSTRHNKTKRRPCDGNNSTNSVKGFTTISKQKRVLNLKIFQRLSHGKRLLLDSRKFEVNQSADGTQSQWLQFDATRAVESWLRERQSNLGVEVQCDNCYRVGARILNDMSSPFNIQDIGSDDVDLVPVLNIISRLGATYKEIRSNKHSSSAEAVHHHNLATLPNGRQRTSAVTIAKHSCQKPNQRCCRHSMEVVFKKIKGFEFIIQPKVFDAGYCRGHCPPRYNPAHHHAMLQGLIWKQNPKNAPRPCCAPSKLVELEVLHVDEKDSEKLKISTWANMRVVECACS